MSTDPHDMDDVARAELAANECVVEVSRALATALGCSSIYGCSQVAEAISTLIEAKIAHTLLQMADEVER